MKNSWLFLGFLFLFARWISSDILLLLFLLVMTVYYVRHYKVHPVYFIFVFFLIYPVFTSSEEVQMPVSQKVHIKGIKSGYVVGDTGKERVILYGADELGFDDLVEVQGTYEKVDTIHNLSMFHFQKWLARRDIHYQIQVKKIHKIKQGKSLRHRLYAKVLKLPTKKGREWVLSMLYQIHTEDISFFITASGMHLSLLAYTLERMLQRFVSKSMASGVVLVFLGISGVLTVFSGSLLRVICFRLIAFLFSKDCAADKTGKSMCLVLILFPYMAYELSFLLPVAFRVMQLFQKNANRIVTSLGVMIPFQLLFFHSCDLIQILLFRFLRPCYAILYALSWLYVFTSLTFLYPFANAFYNVLNFLQGISHSFYYTPNVIWLILWTLSLLHYITYQKKKSALVILCIYALFAAYLNPFGEIMMLDVGQGDCTLILLPYRQGVILVDVMGSHYKNIPKDIIVPVLHSKGIYSIDKVILTHDDYDHSGGLKELQELIEVKEVLREKSEGTWMGKLYIPFLLANYQGVDNNDNSILAYLEVYGLRMLFMGDAGVEVEAMLMEKYANLKVDILKVGHHGSSTSSSLPFLHQLDARIAFISAGRNNRYAHPHKEVLDSLKQENILPLITSKNGGVSIKFCKYFAFFRTAENEFGIIDFR